VGNALGVQRLEGLSGEFKSLCCLGFSRQSCAQPDSGSNGDRQCSVAACQLPCRSSTINRPGVKCGSAEFKCVKCKCCRG